MQFTTALLTGFALIATVVAVPEPRAASFVTWDCNNCAATENCPRHDHQNIPSETCFQLEPGQNSIQVDFTVRPSCTVRLYASGDCSGNGPTFPGDRFCKPIPANERTSYQVIC
ncbi:hypothetical protein CC86DRAFT_460166 [Ophiobolus disseminans]|uniref:Uncharacterized protein n=1 Tax=Ophiobolus disseminans TaxID=1469910 RepID=A0A6A6ZG72_9PLEO|nr:hypothetical protein CC86DRAFT_460166 [Ophiobolus disseminans]